MGRKLYIDVSELVDNPIATGIQRLVRQLLAHWPSDVQAELVYYAHDLQTLVSVPRPVVDLISGPPPRSDSGLAKLKAQIRGLKGVHRAIVTLPSAATILIPELFYDHRRIGFYQALMRTEACRILQVVYDIRPLTAPAAFDLNTDAVNAIMPYFSFFTKVDGHCYISDAVREDVHGRMERGRSRSRDDAVVMPGADALQIEPQTYSAGKTDLLCIGSFDGKKLQERVYAAFKQVPLTRIRRLIFLGALPSRRIEQLDELLTSRDANVLIVDRPADQELARYLRSAIGTIFVSPNEGFGLPPIESLHAGVPVIAYAGVPSIASGKLGGILRLAEPSVESIAEGLLQFDNAEICQQLWAEAGKNRLGSWSEFAVGVASWAARFPAVEKAPIRQPSEGACHDQGPAAKISEVRREG